MRSQTVLTGPGLAAMYRCERVRKGWRIWEICVEVGAGRGGWVGSYCLN